MLPLPPLEHLRNIDVLAKSVFNIIEHINIRELLDDHKPPDTDLICQREYDSNCRIAIEELLVHYSKTSDTDLISKIKVDFLNEIKSYVQGIFMRDNCDFDD